jgi:hypothetical protein
MSGKYTSYNTFKAPSDAEVERENDLSSHMYENTQMEGEQIEEPYTSLSKSVLMTTLVITSLAGMLSPLTSNIYLPALNQIQKVLYIYTISH